MEAIGILGIIVSIVSTIASPVIAHDKGRSAIGWFFGGLFLSGLGLIIVCCLPNKNN